MTLSCVSAHDNSTTDLQINDNQKLQDASSDLENQIINANDGDEIIINPGTYRLHNVTISKNMTIQGNGNPEDIIIDGEQISSILLIRSDAVHVTLKNITFINALTDGFGGAISMETGHVYVDNCNFINNTAGVNAGGISNYGTEEQPGYLLVNNSLFVNNHAEHDGGAVTTCYATSHIYNSVFIANSAHRDGGAVRVSVFGYATVEDCIFMFNHADEWGGAYYSWASNSIINRCIFLNNTGGTNGGAVMVSGNITLTNSILVNNTADETGGSFYIQQPMFEALTVIDVHDNLITNNTSPLGKEIYIKWRQTNLLFTKFNGNDWGDEDPTDSDIIDPDKVTSRSKVTSTKKSNLLDELNLDLLNRYSNTLRDYFPDNYFGDDSSNQETNPNNNENNNQQTSPSNNNNIKSNSSNSINDNVNSNNTNSNAVVNSTSQNSNENNVQANGSDVGSDSSKASEIFKKTSSKQVNSTNIGIILFALIAIIAFAIGYRKQNKNQ